MRPMPRFTNLGDLIRRDQDLNKVAIIDLGRERVREVSYARLDAVANGVARALCRRGLTRGDRVAILSANSAEYLAVYYGIMRAGLVAVPVSFKFPRPTIDFVLRDAGAKLACAAHATIVLLPQFMASAYIDAIGRYRCTWLTAVPPMIAMMLREKELLERTDLSSVEFIRMGSAPVSQTLMEALRRALPHVSVTNAYGTTEAGPVVFAAHPAGLPQPDMSVGYPHPKVELRLVDGADRNASQGVLEMKCPALMNGYHNRPDVSPPFTADGFYVTGDVFRRDGDGFHYFVGRSDDMFVSGGENVYPSDVERMLERHPDIAQAAVVPIDDEIKGQKPVAFVVSRPGRSPSADEIKRFALANAPAYAHPRFVWFVDELPLAATNKVDRTLLHGLAQERLAAAGR